MNNITNNMTIKDISPDYRPDEKFFRYGPAALTGAELLAIILRTGSPGQSSVSLTTDILKSKTDGSEDLLNIFRLELDELTRIRGVGIVKALQIKSVAELSKRIALCRTTQRLDFSIPQTIAEHYMEQLRHRKREVILLSLLNSACRLIKDVYLTEGTVNALIISPREIFIEALKHEAVNVVLLHNHPSGSAAPSKADREMTVRISEAGKLLGITLLDHIIIGDREYYSFRDKGLLN